MEVGHKPSPCTFLPAVVSRLESTVSFERYVWETLVIAYMAFLTWVIPVSLGLTWHDQTMAHAVYNLLDVLLLVDWYRPILFSGTG